MMKGRYGARMEISHEPIVPEFVQRFVITGYLQLLVSQCLVPL